MIRVVYRRDKNQVLISGHANSGEYGHDLVCAAVSALALTLCANVARLDVAGSITQPVMELASGRASISCRAKKDRREPVRQTFENLCLGFELLATQWPEYISYAPQG